MSRGCVRGWGGAYIYHMTYPIMQVMLPTLSHELTQVCESITFTQLLLHAVNIINSKTFVVGLRKMCSSIVMRLHLLF